MSAVGRVKQCFCAWGNFTFAMKQQVANLLAKFGAAGLEGANHGSPELGEVGLDEVRLSCFANSVDSLK